MSIAYQSRTRMFSSSHSWHGSKPCHWFQQSPIAPLIILWYIWVLTSVSAQQTSPHAHKSHQGCPARWLRLCIEKASQNRSQCSSQLVTVVIPWVQRPVVDRSQPVPGPMSGWGAGGGVGGSWRASYFAKLSQIH